MTASLLKNDLLSPQARVVGTIRQWIEHGQLRINDALPSERDICNELGVNRGTVRRALDRLVQEGVVEKDGIRTRVVNTGSNVGTSALFSKMICVLTADQEVNSSEFLIPHAAGGDGSSSLLAIRQRGLHGMSIHPDQLSIQAIEQAIAARPLGVIASEVAMRNSSLVGQMLTAARDASIPAVVYGRSNAFDGFHTVESDHQAGSYALTQWMIGRGCRRILWCGSVDLTTHWVVDRLAGYKHAMDEAGLEAFNPLMVRKLLPRLANNLEHYLCNTRLFAGYLAEYLTGDTPVDGIIAVNDVEALQVIGALKLFGITPGKDVLVGGYDNSWLNYPEHKEAGALIDVTVDKDMFNIGRVMVDMLLEQVQVVDKAATKPIEIKVAPKLIVNSQ